MKLKDLQKAEFWIATILYAFAIVIIISNTSNRNHDFDYYSFKEAKVNYSFFSNYFIPGIFRISIIYFTFLLLNFCIIPALIQRKNEILNYSLILFCIVFIGLVNGVCTTYTDAYLLVQYDSLQQAYNRIFFSSFSYSIWLIILISSYVCAKAFVIYMLENKDRNTQSQNQMRLDVGLGLAFWLVGMLLWLTTRSPFEIIIIWTLVIFSTIGIIIYSLYYLLPYIYTQGKKFKSFFWQVFFISIFLAVPMSFISMFFFYTRPEGIFIVFLFHLPTQLIISAPLAWYVYKRRLASNNELTSLRTELGKSDASLSFLQSQINPHFLFNALNTLYGTALQENAERTGEGIQKLGDMMRFMLHENVQDEISLTRDVDYLENYISLQKLRTSRSADIVIETQIDEQLSNLKIAPMLLIPFVENAFKHGISLQQPSHIKITLQTKEKTLYFDVHNSIHIKPDNDPEKLKSGIGLANVKQRLALLYPKKHELIVRESAKEFFIHLTIQL
ncbi:sensor histidine kinase [Pedobacter boryungensis]|uniref:Histidine kinase n=2 Tax=Pedobacter boryungensis TaxID=869962 RepID=A0ABX2DF96_9SPHI|nr:histidine kinase [Pedobacter boryungensis]NQX32153.1 histidine kinase [Pedobacter boryungensis]